MDIENIEYRELFDSLLKMERPAYGEIPQFVKDEIYDDFLRDMHIQGLLDRRIVSIFDKTFIEYEEVMNVKNIYLDMDGTLCEFKPCYDINILYEKGYFLNLRPREDFLNALKEYMAFNSSDNVYILSNYLSDSSFAYEEKNLWLDRYLPEVDPENRIFVPWGEDKTEHINRIIHEKDVLFDDHTKNLIAWEKAGGKGVKVINNINNKKGTWKGEKLEERPSRKDIEQAVNSSKEKKNAYKI